MYRVNFISTDISNDLVVSFAVAGQSPEEILSLTLLRSPKYESALSPDMRGVYVSWEADEDKSEYLAGIERSKQTLNINTTKRQFDLDLSRLNSRQLRQMSEALQQMNFDKKFKMAGIR